MKSPASADLPVEPSCGEPSLDFTGVYHDNYDFAWRCLRALGVVDAQLDDATQDVFVVVHLRLAEFHRGAPIRAWVYGIARKVAAKYRRRWVRGAGEARPQLELLGAQPEPDQVLLWRERASVVQRFLDALKPGIREVFVLHQLEGFTAPEIATALGINLNTAYSRLRLARLRFEREVDGVEHAKDVGRDDS